LNFLAHAFLSFNDPQILAGNMISDFVKGKTKFNYPPRIQQGIMLHRAIDAFTDAHEATAMAKTFFRPHYRLYSGAIVDILYDHYLANDPYLFTEASLKTFTSKVYQSLEEQAAHLPQTFIYLLPYMKGENWLFNYRTKDGISRSLRGLVRRSSFLSDYQTAINLFEDNYEALGACYALFFKDVKTFAKEQFAQLNL
jgi:acyl carrier protein phosphodiesterase